MKFTVKSCKLIKVFIDVCYKQTLSDRKFKYSLFYSFCIVIKVLKTQHALLYAFPI